MGRALMQCDTDGAECDVCYQSRPIQEAELNYPVHDKEPPALRYALAKSRVYHRGDRPFVVYTDDASLCTNLNSLRLYWRMARGQSSIVKYNLSVEYKP